MIKGFIEVHNNGNDGKPVLINIGHIVDVWGNEIYLDDALSDAADYSCIKCAETYEEIKEKIRDASEKPMMVEVLKNER